MLSSFGSLSSYFFDDLRHAGGKSHGLGKDLGNQGGKRG
jgi:hypothetical protein